MADAHTAAVHGDGRFIFQGATYRAALGRGGISGAKQEGDGATPRGTLPLRRLFYRADRLDKPRASVPVEPIARTDGWCDDPAHRDYNRQITLPHDARHEALWRDDPLYDLVAVLGWNDDPVVRHRGSAIFLHIARADYAPTEGCVALSLVDLVRAMRDGLAVIEMV